MTIAGYPEIGKRKGKEGRRVRGRGWAVFLPLFMLNQSRLCANDFFFCIEMVEEVEMVEFSPLESFGRPPQPSQPYFHKCTKPKMVEHQLRLHCLYMLKNN